MHTQTVSELAAGLRARKFSSLDLTLHFLSRIERLGPELNAFVTVTADRALADARAADELLAQGAGWSAHGRARRAQGHILHRRHPHHVLVEDAGQFRRSLRRDGRAALA